MLLSGPEGTLEYIRQLTPGESLLNDVWAEGGVLVNVDRQSTLFWGGDAIAEYSYLRRPLLAALSLLWPGWSIDWAPFGVEDLARNIGWEVSQVQAQKRHLVHPAFLEGREAIITDTQLLESLRAKDPGTILSVRRSSGEVKDYLLTLSRSFSDKRSKTVYLLDPLYQVLASGPHLLDILPAESALLLPEEGSEQELAEGAYIDEERQTLWIWEHTTLESRYLDAVAVRWPGWQVQGHVEGIVRHITLSGRDPATVRIAERQAVQELITALAEEQGLNPIQISKAIQQALPPEEQQGMVFGKGFFHADAPLLTPQERREVLERLFGELLGHEGQSGID